MLRLLRQSRHLSAIPRRYFAENADDCPGFVFTPRSSQRKNKLKTKVQETVPVESAPGELEFFKQRSLQMEEIAAKAMENNQFVQKTRYISTLEWLKNGGEIKDFANEDLKQYPNHIRHWNHDDPGFVHDKRYNSPFLRYSIGSECDSELFYIL